MSIAIENFVKIIYQFEQNKCLDTKPGSIAKALNISNAAATDMARKLAVKNLILHKKYHALKLTPEGKKLALKILRKHRLWETFLYKTFDLTLHEIHREAELLEHQTSEFMVEKISEFLGNPAFDPHGDPIPDSLGEINFGTEHQLLSMAKQQEYYEITRLVSSNKEFFDFCTKNSIDLGKELYLEHQYNENKMTEIVLGNSKLLLNSEFSNIIYVKQLKK